MPLLGMVEIPHPFDPSARLRTGYAQGMLQAKRKSVMPAKAESSAVAEGRRHKTWIPAFAGKTEGDVEFQSTM